MWNGKIVSNFKITKIIFFFKKIKILFVSPKYIFAKEVLKLSYTCVKILLYTFFSLFHNSKKKKRMKFMYTNKRKMFGYTHIILYLHTILLMWLNVYPFVYICNYFRLIYYINIHIQIYIYIHIHIYICIHIQI